MSTHAIIALETDTNKFRYIYCHNDGIPTYTGKMLMQHYSFVGMVNKLIDLGNISTLEQRVNPAQEEAHTFSKPAKNVTVAYGRDRGEKGQSASVANSLTELISAAKRDHASYLYVFNRDGVWSYMNLHKSEKRLVTLESNDLENNHLLMQELMHFNMNLVEESTDIIDTDFYEDAGTELGKVQHKARLDKMNSEDLLAHVIKNADELKYPGEKVNVGDIKGTATRLAMRLGHTNNNAYWNKIKHLVKEDASLLETSLSNSDSPDFRKDLIKLGEDHGVDFKDADGKAVLNAMMASYKKGHENGIQWEKYSQRIAAQNTGKNTNI